jgi:hypothetical protein
LTANRPVRGGLWAKNASVAIRTGPSRLLGVRPAPAAALAAPGGRAVYAVTFAPDGATLAAADGNGRTYLWDMAGGLAAALAHPASRGANGVALASAGDLLAAADGNGCPPMADEPACYLTIPPGKCRRLARHQRS